MARSSLSVPCDRAMTCAPGKTRAAPPRAGAQSALGASRSRSHNAIVAPAWFIV